MHTKNMGLQSAINEAFEGFWARVSYYGDVQLPGLDERDLKRRLKESVQEGLSEQRQARVEEMEAQLRRSQAKGAREDVADRDGIQGLQRELEGAHAAIAVLLEDSGDSERKIPLTRLQKAKNTLQVGNDPEAGEAILRIE